MLEILILICFILTSVSWLFGAVVGREPWNTICTFSLPSLFLLVTIFKIRDMIEQSRMEKEFVQQRKKEPMVMQPVAVNTEVSIPLDEDAMKALMTLRIGKIEAAKAVRKATETLGPGATTQQIITEALRPK